MTVITSNIKQKIVAKESLEPLLFCVKRLFEYFFLSIFIYDEKLKEFSF